MRKGSPIRMCSKFWKDEICSQHLYGMSWEQASNPSHQFMITVSNMKPCAGEASKGGGRAEAKAGHGVEEDKFWLDSQRMSGVLWILGITLETQEPHQEQKLSTFHANMNRGVFSENLSVVSSGSGSRRLEECEPKKIMLHWKVSQAQRRLSHWCLHKMWPAFRRWTQMKRTRMPILMLRTNTRRHRQKHSQSHWTGGIETRRRRWREGDEGEGG